MSHVKILINVVWLSRKNSKHERLLSKAMKIIYMPNEINNDQLQGLTHSHLKTNLINLINLEFGRGCESDVYYYMMYMVKRGSKNGCAMEVERGLLD